MGLIQRTGDTQIPSLVLKGETSVGGPGSIALPPFGVEGWGSRLDDSLLCSEEPNEFFVGTFAKVWSAPLNFVSCEPGSESRAAKWEGSIKRSTRGRRVLIITRHKAMHDTVIIIWVGIIEYVIQSCSGR
jgi:hypothetical protein